MNRREFLKMVALSPFGIKADKEKASQIHDGLVFPFAFAEKEVVVESEIEKFIRIFLPFVRNND